MRNMFSELSKNSFWLAGEEEYDSRQASNPIDLSPGCNFWLMDDMNYDLVEAKARGAFATVWRAKERVTGRVLAVKKFESSDMRKTKVAVRNQSQILDASRSGVSISTSH
jgi:hypothetical protein